MAVVLPGAFVYLPHPYTGEEAVTEALMGIEGAFKAIDKRKGIGHYHPWEKIKPLCKDRLTGEEILLSTIRYPYPLLFSIWKRMRNHSQVTFMERRLGRDATFKEFIDLWLELDMPPFLREGRLFYHKAAEYIRAENLENGLNQALRKIRNAPNKVRLPKHHSTIEEHWSGAYPDPLYTYVNERFGQDFIQFGYPFVWSKNPLT